MTLWILWSIVVSAAIAIAAIAVERGVAHLRKPRRIVWLAAIGIAALAPVAIMVLAGASASQPALGPSSVANSQIGMQSVTTQTNVAGAPNPTTVAPIQTRSVAGTATTQLLQAIALADSWIVTAWLAASAGVLLAFMAALIGTVLARRRWLEGEVDSVAVLITGDVGPAVVGVLRPRIVIPRWTMDLQGPVRALLLQHEKEHIRARDPLSFFTAAFALLLFPWNAALWWMLRRLRLAIEIDCDARVISAGQGVSEYGQMLLTVGAHPARTLPLATALADMPLALEKRIEAMTANRTRRPLLTSLALFAVAGGVAILISMAPQPQPLSATMIGGARQQSGRSFRPDQINEWSSVRVTAGEDPHAYGLTLKMWRNDTTVAGYLAEYTGFVADPPMGRLDSIKFDAPSGRISFAATARKPAILGPGPLTALIDVYEFNGVIDDSTMRGTLRKTRTNPADQKGSREENIVLRKMPLPSYPPTQPSFQSWLEDQEATLKFQHGEFYVPPTKAAPAVRLSSIAPVVPGANTTEKFTLEASYGQTVEHEFGSGLIFRLAANRDAVTPGWTIEVRPEGERDGEVELSWPATPPYRGWNGRYLDVSYNYTAAQALQMKTREFFFIRNPLDYSRTAAAVRSLLWSDGIPDDQLDESRKLLDEVAKCAGTVRIIDGRLGKHAVSTLAPAERIEWLKVEVELCTRQAAAPGIPARVFRSPGAGPPEQAQAGIEAALRNVPTRVPELEVSYLTTVGSSVSAYYVRPGEPTGRGSAITLLIRVVVYVSAEDADRRALVERSVVPSATGIYKGLKVYRWGDRNLSIVAGNRVLSIAATNQDAISLLMKVADGLLVEIGSIEKHHPEY